MHHCKLFDASRQKEGKEKKRKKKKETSSLEGLQAGRRTDAGRTEITVKKKMIIRRNGWTQSESLPRHPCRANLVV